MKKFKSYIIVLILLSLITIYSYSDSSLIIDEYGVFSSQEIDELNQTAWKIKKQYGIDTVIYITDSFNGLYSGEYADSFYLKNGFSDNCSILLIAVDDREYYLYNCGEASIAITDYGSYYIDEKVVPHLSQDAWFKAAKAYLEYNEAFYKEYFKTGQAFDYNNKPVEPEEIILKSCGCLLFGFILSGVSLSKKKKELKSVSPVSNADNYADYHTFRLHNNTDRFITKNISRTPIPKYEDRGPSGGFHGGTTMHTSSSGHSYSGHGGHF